MSKFAKIFYIIVFITSVSTYSTHANFKRLMDHELLVLSSSLSSLIKVKLIKKNKDLSLYFSLKALDDIIQLNKRNQRLVNLTLRQWEIYHGEFNNFLETNGENKEKLALILQKSKDIKFLENTILNLDEVTGNKTSYKALYRTVLSLEEFSSYIDQMIMRILSFAQKNSGTYIANIVRSEIENALKIDLDSDIKILRHELYSKEERLNTVFKNTQEIIDVYKGYDYDQLDKKIRDDLNAKFEKKKEDLAKTIDDFKDRINNTVDYISDEQKELERKGQEAYLKLVRTQKHAQKQLQTVRNALNKYNEYTIKYDFNEFDFENINMNQLNDYINNISERDLVHGMAGLVGHSDPAAADSILKVYQTYGKFQNLIENYKGMESLSMLNAASLSMGVVGIAFTAFNAMNSQSESYSFQKIMESVLRELKEIKTFLKDFHKDVMNQLEYQNNYMKEMNADIIDRFDSLERLILNQGNISQEILNTQSEFLSKMNDNTEYLAQIMGEILFEAIKVDNNTECRSIYIETEVDKEKCIDKLIQYYELKNKFYDMGSTRRLFNSGLYKKPSDQEYLETLEPMLRELVKEVDLDIDLFDIPSLKHSLSFHKDMLKRFEDRSRGTYIKNIERRNYFYNNIMKVKQELIKLSTFFKQIREYKTYSNILYFVLDYYKKGIKKIEKDYNLAVEKTFSKRLGISLDEYQRIQKEINLENIDGKKKTTLDKIMGFPKGRMVINSCSSNGMPFTINTQSIIIPDTLKRLSYKIGTFKLCVETGMVESKVTMDNYLHGTHDYVKIRYYSVPYVAIVFKPSSSVSQGIRNMMSVGIRKNCKENDKSCYVNLDYTYRAEFRSTKEYLYSYDQRAESRNGYYIVDRGNGPRDSTRRLVSRHNVVFYPSSVERTPIKNLRSSRFNEFLEEGKKHSEVKAYINDVAEYPTGNDSYTKDTNEIVAQFNRDFLIKNSFHFSSTNYSGNVAFSLKSFLKNANSQLKSVVASLIVKEMDAKSFFPDIQSHNPDNNSIYEYQNLKRSLERYHNLRIGTEGLLRAVHLDYYKSNPFVTSLLYHPKKEKRLPTIQDLLVDMVETGKISDGILSETEEEIQRRIDLTLPGSDGVFDDMLERYRKLEFFVK